MTFDQLHQRALECVKRFKSAESELISILQTIDENKGFRLMGYASLFAYATKALHLSEAHAYTLITVSRKAKEIPELKKAISEGVITTNQARRITSVITPENKTQWIDKAATLSQRELEKEIVKVAPEQAVRETMKYVAPVRVKLVCGINEGLMKKLQQVQDILSQQKRSAASLEEALDELTRFYLEKKDPVKKAKRVLGKPPRNSARYEKPVSLPKAAGGRRTAIPARIKHEVMKREGGQCSHKLPDGSRCEQKRWLAFHHRKAVAEGGTNTSGNLTLLCHSHHALEHDLSMPG